MSRDLKRVPISEVAIGIYDGPHATPPLAGNGPVYLGIGNITESGHLDLSDARCISEADFPNWTKRVTPRSGDIVFTYEATLNRYAIIPKGFRGCLGRRTALIRPDTNKVDTRFLFYTFFGREWRNTIEANRLSGATVDRIPIAKFPNFPVRLPPLDTQRRISAILGAYDDLIEVNRRRIAILEEMARRLFDEWFVCFRYPGRQITAAKTNGLDQLPSGWAEVPLFDVCDRITDGAHHSPPGTSAGRMMASVKDMRDWGFDLTKCRQISEADFEALVRMGCQPEPGDILIAKDGANLNKHTFLVTDQLPLVLLSSIAIIRPRAGIEREFLVALLKSEKTSSAIKRMRSGAAIPRIVLKDFKRLAILMPPKDIRQKFETVITPLHELCRLLGRVNTNLAAQRDELLPRLISSELSVSAAEREFEAAS